jgi:hypothetical protein
MKFDADGSLEELMLPKVGENGPEALHPRTVTLPKG